MYMKICFSFTKSLKLGPPKLNFWLVPGWLNIMVELNMDQKQSNFVMVHGGWNLLLALAITYHGEKLTVDRIIF